MPQKCKTLDELIDDFATTSLDPLGKAWVCGVLVVREGKDPGMLHRADRHCDGSGVIPARPHVPVFCDPSAVCACIGDRSAADGKHDAILLCHVADVAIGSGCR